LYEQKKKVKEERKNFILNLKNGKGERKEKGVGTPEDCSEDHSDKSSLDGDSYHEHYLSHRHHHTQVSNPQNNPNVPFVFGGIMFNIFI
jgi:hypothetical protein